MPIESATIFIEPTTVFISYVLKRPKVELSEEEWEASFNDSTIRRKSLFHMSF